MVRLLSMTSWPLLRMMVPVTAKSMVSPPDESKMAWRSVPAPLSERDVTVRVAPWATPPEPQVISSVRPRAKRHMARMTGNRTLGTGMLCADMFASCSRADEFRRNFALTGLL